MPSRCRGGPVIAQWTPPLGWWRRRKTPSLGVWTGRARWGLLRHPTPNGLAMSASEIGKWIGRRMAVIRKHRRMSQGELAAAIGVTKSIIANWEHARSRIPAPRLEHLVCALSCRLADLLCSRAQIRRCRGEA
jgi:DNA-binding Xre family transcriptional regulator